KLTKAQFLAKMEEESYRRLFGEFIRERRIEKYYGAWKKLVKNVKDGKKLERRTFTRLESGKHVPSEHTLQCVREALLFNYMNHPVEEVTRWSVERTRESENRQLELLSTSVPSKAAVTKTPAPLTKLRAGYAVFPQYTILGSTEGAPQGFSVDLVQRIAK